MGATATSCQLRIRDVHLASEQAGSGVGHRLGDVLDRSRGVVALIRKLSLKAFCRSLWGALWSKTLFVIGTCALIVAAANSEINATAVEAAGFESRVRCTGLGVTYFPNERLLIVDDVPFRFRHEEATGEFPSAVTLRDTFTGEAFVIHPSGAGLTRHSIARVSDPNFGSRDLDCNAIKEVM